jgi:hypothetical protein
VENDRHSNSQVQDMLILIFANARNQGLEYKRTGFQRLAASQQSEIFLQFLDAFS